MRPRGLPSVPTSRRVTYRPPFLSVGKTSPTSGRLGPAGLPIAVGRGCEKKSWWVVRVGERAVYGRPPSLSCGSVGHGVACGRSDQRSSPRSSANVVGYASSRNLTQQTHQVRVVIYSAFADTAQAQGAEGSNARRVQQEGSPPFFRRSLEIDPHAECDTGPYDAHKIDREKETKRGTPSKEAPPQSVLSSGYWFFRSSTPIDRSIDRLWDRSTDRMPNPIPK